MSTSINVNSTQISTLLQLYPMAIPGAEENLQPPGAYHLGIPESIHSPSTKLFMVIDPVTLFSTPFAAGESVRLWVNSQATSVIKNIYPGEENDRIFMELFWGLLKDGLNTLYYEVTRVGGNKDKSDPILNVLLNNPVSGITVSHPPSIGPGQPATFTLMRDYAREYDVMTLTVGTWSKTIPYVHPANPVTYTLTTTDLQQIGDGTHSVSATIKDQLNNLRVSPTTSIVITANTLVLPPPSVTGQTGNNFNPTLQNVEVVVPAGTLLSSDKVHVEWEGAISASGASYKSAQQLVSAGLKFPVPRSVLAYSLGKVVKVTYVIERNGVSTSSQVLPLNILPLPVSALIPPKILQADANNVLDVTALGTQNATIHALLFTLIADGMPCWLSLEGKKPDGTAHNLALWNGLPSRVNPTWVSQGFWPAALVNSYLKQLGDGTSLHIKFAVSMDMSNVRATAVEFPDRVYTIKAMALVNATITKVNENTAGGAAVANGGSTTATTLVIGGNAVAGQQVQVLKGGAVIATVTASTAGTFSHTVTGQAVGSNSYTVKGLYGASPESPPWVVNIVANVNATITKVNENTATGAAVANGGSTTATTLVIGGNAVAGQQVQVLKGGAVIATVTASTAGTFSHTVTGQAVGSNSYTVKGLYGASPESPPWVVNIVANVNATITKVNENTATGAAVANGGSTTATTLVIGGNAVAGQQVQVLKGGAVIATVTASTAGTFSHTVTGQAVGSNSYTVKGLYGASPESPPWVVNIVANVNATITKVNENTATGAVVANGGTTTATTLVISGAAAKAQKVELRNHNTVLATVTADAQGVFSYTHVDATMGARSYTVQGLNGGSPVSPAWRLSVVKKAAFLEVRRGDRNPNGQLLSSGVSVPKNSVVTFYLKDVPSSHTYSRIWCGFFPNGSNISPVDVFAGLRNPPAGTHNYPLTIGGPMYYWADTTDVPYDYGSVPELVHGGEFIIYWV